MNSEGNTTSVKRPQDSVIVSSLKDMEIEFHGLLCMATLLVEKLDNIVDKKNHVESNDRSAKILIENEDIRVASFVWYDVLTRCEQIKKTFLERLYPDEVQP